jgi:signal transduction histidine kinase
MTAAPIAEPIKVLLVEDSLEEARLLYEGLTEALPANFEMAHMRRLSEALEWLWAERCDVILLDLGLPDSHGLDTLTLARAQVPRVPIVVLTGFEDEGLAMEALKKGAQDYMVKGQVDGKSLARSLRYAMARKQAEEGLVKQMVALARADALRLSRRRIIAAQEALRRAIAARLEEAQERISPSPELAQLLAQVEDRLGEIVEQEVRLLSQQLYPSCLSQGLVAALRSLGSHFEKDFAIETEVDEALVRREQENCNWVPEVVRLAAYRIAEEALTNVAKHAAATRVLLQLSLPKGGWLCLTVWDDGRGFNMEDRRGGLGIATMEDYAESLGGEHFIRSAPGMGTQVKTSLSLLGAM